MRLALGREARERFPDIAVPQPLERAIAQLPHTLEEIGGMLGVTRERVRQLRDRALKRLRDGDVGKALASFAA